MRKIQVKLNRIFISFIGAWDEGNVYFIISTHAEQFLFGKRHPTNDEQLFFLTVIIGFFIHNFRFGRGPKNRRFASTKDMFVIMLS